eukprot:CAMPEP_0184496830 /NCGR_PEP_ID=MMETSP0113_2-20130426/34983_1 /TAXON_ID=91329 /ORGANISM="Norrisiella sphaerica, Strain BC52" /LENGTH=513 /DNA_ID=CAMNT_0026883645 /DNA_START=156 /DNA_END=1697 /DNA_ORIENTATION=-
MNIRPLSAIASILLISASTALLYTDPLPSDHLTCNYSVVGAGWAGVYFAYRLVESGHVANASDVCLFEKTARFGGRTYSKSVVPNATLARQFIVELGAYRFSPDMHLPGDLILKELGLYTECWDPGCPDAAAALDLPAFNYHAPLQKLIDVYSMNRGYGVAIYEMIYRLKEAGARIFIGSELVGFQGDFSDGQNISKFSITAADGKSMTVAFEKLFLNTPRAALRKIRGAEELMAKDVFTTFNCTRMDLPEEFANLHAEDALVKAYVYYSDAWWISKLGLTDGSYPKQEFIPTVSANGVPLAIHYNDGPAVCRAGTDSRGEPIYSGDFVPFGQCEGFLQSFYSFVNVSWFTQFQVDKSEPFIEIRASNGEAQAQALADMHQALMDAHKPLFQKLNVSLETIPLPSIIVISSWRRDHVGTTAPTKVYYNTTLEKACGLKGLTEESYRRTLLQPFANKNVFLANNDYRATRSDQMYGDWAEESLLMAERALRTIGISKPSWLNGTYYEQHVTEKL